MIKMDCEGVNITLSIIVSLYYPPPSPQLTNTKKKKWR